MPKADEFLLSFSSIGANQAEYNILSSMYETCKNMIFLFELTDLKAITSCYQNAVKFINQHYKSHELRLFTLFDSTTLLFDTIDVRSGTSMKDEELFNYAIRFSKERSSYILVRATSSFVLLHNGEFDKEFENIYADRQKLAEAESRKYNIDQLDQVFEQFHVDRKHNGCEYVVDGKVSNTISEQKLRNNLIEYLKKETNMFVVAELCTSQTEDEESVDISVIDKNKSVSIIEVKYFVKKGMFEDPGKVAYSFSRFADGYQQLDRYCIHLNQDNYSLHSAYLYMFYSHTKSLLEVTGIAKDYLDQFLANPKCSDYFKRHYKGTICDNILERKIAV